MRKRLGLLSRIVVLAAVTLIVIGAERRNIITHGGPVPPHCPPTGCTGGGKGH